MTDSGGKAKPPPHAPGSRGLKFFIGFSILAGLMLFLFWPVVKFIASLVLG
jgi:hypothetical protein